VSSVNNKGMLSSIQTDTQLRTFNVPLNYQKYYKMNNQFKIPEDGSLVADKRSCRFLKRIAKMWGRTLERRMTEQRVAVVLMLANLTGKLDGCTREAISEYLLWVIDRTDQEPDKPITRYEIEAIIGVRGWSFSQDGCSLLRQATPMFQDILGLPQREIDIPVEWHHVAYAFVWAVSKGLKSNTTSIEKGEVTDVVATALKEICKISDGLPRMKVKGVGDGSPMIEIGIE